MADKEKKIDIKVDLNEKFGESMENGFDAIGKIFGGLVGAIKDAIGPEMMKSLGAATWLGQVAECLEKMSKSLSTDGRVPDEPAGPGHAVPDRPPAPGDRRVRAGGRRVGAAGRAVPRLSLIHI